MFLVLLGHCYLYFDKNLESSWYLHSTIYMFHMPLFMLLSGFFAESSLVKSFWSMIHSKFTKLIIPALTSSVFFCTFLLITGHTMKTIETEFIGGNWFLKTLFICYIIAYISNMFFKNNQLVAFIISWIILIIVPVSFLQINWMYLFFWIGIFLRKYFGIIINHQMSILILSMILGGICTFIHFYFKIPNYIELTFLTLTSSPLYHLIRIVNALSWSITIILLFYKISEILEHQLIFRTIAESGKYTLGIYVLHPIILKLIICFPSIECSSSLLFNFLYMPLLAIAIYIICIFIIKLISKNSYCDIIAFGGQYHHSNK